MTANADKILCEKVRMEKELIKTGLEPSEAKRKLAERKVTCI